MTVSATMSANAPLLDNAPAESSGPERPPSRQVRRALERDAAARARREDRTVAEVAATVTDGRIVAVITARPDGSVRVKTNLSPPQQAMLFATLAQIAAQRLAPESPIVGPGGEALPAATPGDAKAEPLPPADAAPSTEPARSASAGE